MRLPKKGQVAALGLVSVGVSNQAISSLTNFGYGLYLLRVLAPADFGRYSIGFATMLFLEGFSQGFFLIQMVVHSPAKVPTERRLYAARILLMLAGTSLVLLAIGTTIAGVLSIVSSAAAGSVMGVTLMAVAYALKEFHTRHAFNEGRGGRAVQIHAAVAALLLLGVGGASLLGVSVTLELAFGLYAGAHACAAAMGHALAGLPMRGHSLSGIKADLAEIAVGGRWAALTKLLYSLRTQAHTIVVAIALGPIGVAQINAGRMLITPAAILIPAMSQVVLPQMAKAAARGGRTAVIGSMWRTGLGLISIALVYSTLVLYFWPQLSAFILGNQYDGLFWIAALWCVYACLLGARNSAEFAAQAMRMFRSLTFISAFCAPVALASVWFLAGYWGLGGAVLGVITGEIAMVVAVGYLVLRGQPTGAAQRSHGVL